MSRLDAFSSPAQAVSAVAWAAPRRDLVAENSYLGVALDRERARVRELEERVRTLEGRLADSEGALRRSEVPTAPKTRHGSQSL